MLKTDNLTTTKSRNLNLLEHSGPIQACNGTAAAAAFTYGVVSYEYRFSATSGFFINVNLCLSCGSIKSGNCLGF